MDEHYYDTNLVGHLPLKKHIEASAWSRAKGIAGMDIKDITLPHLGRHGEFGLRPLSNGNKFTGVVLTRTIAESVLLSQISKQLRYLNVDIDGTRDEWYRHNNQTPPHKVHEGTKYIKPIVDSFTQALKPILKYRTTYQDTQQATTDAAHQLQELQEEAAKYKQKLQEAGIDTTPTRKRKPATTLEDNLPVQRSSHLKPKEFHGRPPA